MKTAKVVKEIKDSHGNVWFHVGDIVRVESYGAGKIIARPLDETKKWFIENIDIENVEIQ